MIGTTYMANPYMAPIEMILPSPSAKGVYTPQPFTIITTGNLSIVNQQAASSPTCALPTSIPTGAGVPTPFPTNTWVNTPAPCWTGYFDQGDGAVFKNDAHDVQITAARFHSGGQASIHILNAGDYIHVVGNRGGLG